MVLPPFDAQASLTLFDACIVRVHVCVWSVGWSRSDRLVFTIKQTSSDQLSTVMTFMCLYIIFQQVLCVKLQPVYSPQQVNL